MPKIHLLRQRLWNGRFYGPGDVEVPNSLAIALGIHAPKTATVVELHPPEREAIASKVVPADTWLKLLEAFNRASSGRDLEPIPTIGRAAGALIIKRRPEGGYNALDQVESLNADLANPPYKVDWERVKGYAS